MSKAEERALEAYPEDIEEFVDVNCVQSVVDNNSWQRTIFLEGYRQAEKDLELTWEDIPKILSISEQLKTSWWFRDNEQTKQIGTQVFWEEVLKKFKDLKNENQEL